MFNEIKGFLDKNEQEDIITFIYNKKWQHTKFKHMRRQQVHKISELENNGCFKLFFQKLEHDTGEKYNELVVDERKYHYQFSIPTYLVTASCYIQLIGNETLKINNESYNLKERTLIQIKKAMLEMGPFSSYAVLLILKK